MKYCGLELPCEKVEKLFNFIHANYAPEQLIRFNDETLKNIALDNKKEWDY